jgi:2-polyprenyl-3-methyl-5-hydroxy-6-metoxy-1,4-benzoquinol methylase
LSEIYAPCHLAGGMTKDYWDRDPRRLAFVLARYKHVARMIEGKRRVLEVGCADGFGARIVRQHVGELTAVDIDAASIDEAKRWHLTAEWPVEYEVRDILEGPILRYDAVYSLDVLEHIAPELEEKFLLHMSASAPVAVIGTPSLESQAHASELSRAGHVNCKSGADLKKALARHWKQVFLFGMNDETLHTGFPPMSHYLLALCVA